LVVLFSLTLWGEVDRFIATMEQKSGDVPAAPYRPSAASSQPLAGAPQDSG